MLNDQLLIAYTNAVLRLGHDRALKVDLRQPLSDACRHLLTEFGLGSTFAVITASNPDGRPASAVKNRWRNLRMRARIASSGCRFIRADGESPDRSHVERGFAVALSRADAHALARENEQLALYWFDGARFWLDFVRDDRAPKALP